MHFEPHKWQTPESACFSYATNEPRLGIANLGGLKSVIPAWRSFSTIGNIEFVREKGRQDGFIFEEERKFNPSEEHVFAVLTGIFDTAMQELDCHHIRIDEDGHCSHKPGIKPPEKIIIPEGKSISEHLLDIYSVGKLKAWLIGFAKIPNTGLQAHFRF